MKIIYIGPSGTGVGTDDDRYWFDPGEPVEVPDELAGRPPRPPSGNPDEEDYDPGDEGEGLLAQSIFVEADLNAASVADVLAEVADDPGRASAALAAEQARGSNARKTLVAKLEAIVKTEEQ